MDSNSTHSEPEQAGRIQIARPGNHLEIVFVLGPPGTGKGTLCKKFTSEHKYFHISVGDYLRVLNQ